MRRNDLTPLEFADAIRECATGESELQRSAAAQRLVAMLANPRPHRGGNRRGPKPKHDRTWADSRLLEFAIEDPDGLPAIQGKLVERLRSAFEKKGGIVPRETWLRDVVGEFYARAAAQDRELGEKYRNSPELIPLFPSAKDFIFYTRMNARLEERWRDDKSLQQKHLTAADYIASLTNLKPEIELKIGAELAEPSGILSGKSLK